MDKGYIGSSSYYSQNQTLSLKLFQKSNIKKIPYEIYSHFLKFDLEIWHISQEWVTESNETGPVLIPFGIFLFT